MTIVILQQHLWSAGGKCGMMMQLQDALERQLCVCVWNLGWQNLKQSQGHHCPCHWQSAYRWKWGPVLQEEKGFHTASPLWNTNQILMKQLFNCCIVPNFFCTNSSLKSWDTWFQWQHRANCLQWQFHCEEDPGNLVRWDNQGASQFFMCRRQGHQHAQQCGNL